MSLDGSKRFEKNFAGLVNARVLITVNFTNYFIIRGNTLIFIDIFETSHMIFFIHIIVNLFDR